MGEGRARSGANDVGSSAWGRGEVGQHRARRRIRPGRARASSSRPGPGAGVRRCSVNAAFHCSFFGGSAPAGAATLSGPLLGIAAGSATLGARARGRWPHPLVAFGLLELCVAVGLASRAACWRSTGRSYPGRQGTLARAARGVRRCEAPRMARLGIGTMSSSWAASCRRSAGGPHAAEGGVGASRSGGLDAVSNLAGAAVGSLTDPVPAPAAVRRHGGGAWLRSRVSISVGSLATLFGLGQLRD